MVSQKFMDSLTKNIRKELKKVISQGAEVMSYPPGNGLCQTIPSELKHRFVPFHFSEPLGEECVFARIHVNDPNLDYFDFATHVEGNNTRTYQGVGTFVAYVPHPIPETFVERRILGSGCKLLPFREVVQQKQKPKDVARQATRSQAVNAINADKKLCKLLKGNSVCGVDQIVSFQKILVIFERNNYPPHRFTLVPYHGHTIIIAKDAGKEGAKIDAPRYPFKDRFAALSKVASYIAQYPQEGEDVGMFFMDPSLETIITPLLRYIDGE